MTIDVAGPFFGGAATRSNGWVLPRRSVTLETGAYRRDSQPRLRHNRKYTRSDVGQAARPPRPLDGGRNADEWCRRPWVRLLGYDEINFRNKSLRPSGRCVKGAPRGLLVPHVASYGRSGMCRRPRCFGGNSIDSLGALGILSSTTSVLLRRFAATLIFSHGLIDMEGHDTSAGG